MAYVRGNPKDYDSWADIVKDPLWGWTSVERIFRRMENCSGIDTCIDRDLRGMSGPLDITVKKPVNPLATAFVRSAACRGHEVGDYNGAAQERVSILQTTTKRGVRHTSADAYIWSVLGKRPNLHVLLHAEVSRILFKPTEDGSSTQEATGVVLHVGSGSAKRTVNVTATTEVIVCASAVGSPKLLLLSGIGPREDLQRLGIPCVHHSEHVGRNLEDHLVTAVMVNASEANPKKDIGTVNAHKAQNFPRGLWSFFEWMLFGTGHLASSTYDTCLFMKSGMNTDLPYPDIQLGGCMNICMHG